MKFLLSLILFLGIPLSALAHGVENPDMDQPPYCYVQPTGAKLWYACDSEEAKMADCLKLMELAMKAAEEAYTLGLPDEKFLKLWNRAKNSCWSDLKDLQPQHYH